MPDKATYATRSDVAQLRETMEDMHERTGRRIKGVEDEYKDDHDRLVAVTGVGVPTWTCGLSKQRAKDHGERLGKVEVTVGQLEHRVIRASVRGGGVVAGALTLLGGIAAVIIKLWG